MNVVIEKVQFATGQLVEALNRLLPQLSSDPPTLTMGDVERILHSDSAALFVAKEGPRIVGMLTLITFRIPTGRRAWIEDVVVDADARGEGIGEQLTEAAIAEATTARRANHRPHQSTVARGRQRAVPKDGL